MAWGCTSSPPPFRLFFLPVVTVFLLGSAAAAMSPVGLVEPALLPATPPCGVIRGGYYPSGVRWSLPPSSIPFSYFTHIFYTFVQTDPTSHELVITNNDGEALLDFAATLHRQKPPLRALLSIGGRSSNATTFAQLAGNPASRSAFIKSTIAVSRRYGLDGLELAWEFPRDPAQMEHLGLLLREWRCAVEEEAAETGRLPLLLTAAVYFAPRFFLSGDVPRTYPLDALRAAVDFVNLRSYDYHGFWDTSATGAHAALYDPKGSNLSTSYGVESWVGAGMPPEKMVLGLPLYGKSWRLKDPSEHGVGAPAVGTGPGRRGVLTYAEVVEFNSATGAKEVYDESIVWEYSYSGFDWIGYDGPRSVSMLVEYSIRHHFTGYICRTLDEDLDWIISKTASDALSRAFEAVH